MDESRQEILNLKADIDKKFPVPRLYFDGQQDMDTHVINIPLKPLNPGSKDWVNAWTEICAWLTYLTDRLGQAEYELIMNQARRRGTGSRNPTARERVLEATVTKIKRSIEALEYTQVGMSRGLSRHQAESYRVRKD